MKTSHKIVVTFFSVGILMGSACAQSTRGEEPQAEQLAQEDTQRIRYGRKMKEDTSYDGYCEIRASCSGYRKANRMSHHDRQMLRQQVNEAGKTLYPNHHNR